ncbi:uncharacterized protein UHOD_12139 [Ustilago sp. UG-2017b]|nr:uncharacterized protein UHOD_12139 [Ustilago sp. UG-2017b]
MLTAPQLSATRWLPLPSNPPDRDYLSLQMFPGEILSSNLGRASSPSAVTAVCCTGDTTAVGGLGASSSSFEDLTGLCLQST